MCALVYVHMCCRGTQQLPSAPPHCFAFFISWLVAMTVNLCEPVRACPIFTRVCRLRRSRLSSLEHVFGCRSSLFIHSPLSSSSFELHTRVSSVRGAHVSLQALLCKERKANSTKRHLAPPLSDTVTDTLAPLALSTPRFAKAWHTHGQSVCQAFVRQCLV